jgi:hypothetical protein
MNTDLKYPTLNEMHLKLEETAPKGWKISEGFHFISVEHPSLTEEQFIAFLNADTVCGDMEDIYNPDEIAYEFWFQVKEFYPELFN